MCNSYLAGKKGMKYIMKGIKESRNEIQKWKRPKYFCCLWWSQWGQDKKHCWNRKGLWDLVVTVNECLCTHIKVRTEKRNHAGEREFQMDEASVCWRATPAAWSWGWDREECMSGQQWDDGHKIGEAGWRRAKKRFWKEQDAKYK